MRIRLATEKDYSHIYHALNRKGINYISANHAKEDISKNQLYVIEENEKVIAQCALVVENNYNYIAIKRLVIYNKKDCGKGIAQRFIEYFKSFGIENLGCTPWTENTRMRKILERNGFIHQYTFLNCYEFYLLN